MLQAIKQKAASFRLPGTSAPDATVLPAHDVSRAPTLDLFSRAVAQIVTEDHAIEGPGFEIARPFPTRKIRNFDPWLLFDAFGPKTVQAGDPILARSRHLGQHPHRGFEAITYHVAGEYDHYDSTGRHGRMAAGTVQLMTAGGGIVHGGAPTPEAAKSGTFLHGYQIWLALPAAQRLCPARSLDLHASDTPVVTSPDGRVWARVLASPLPVYGAACDKLPTAIPIMLVHYILQPGGVVRQAVPSDYNVMVHVSTGTGHFGPGLTKSASQEQCVMFQRYTGTTPPHSSKNSSSTATAAGGETLVEFSCPADATRPLDVMLLAGRPTDETIVQHGPFVGGSMQDIYAAQADFQAGRMGALAPDGSPAPLSAWAAVGGK